MPLRLPSDDAHGGRALPSCRRARRQCDHDNVSLPPDANVGWHTADGAGSVMNPVDHPHGGGGQSPIGHDALAARGLAYAGVRTRKKSKPSSKFIVRRRYGRK